MPDITHHFGFAAPKADVFEALATVEGLTSWWAERVEGDPSPGGTLRFYFGNPGPAATMQVVESDPDTGVKWRCVRGPDDWLETTVTFDSTAMTARRSCASRTGASSRPPTSCGTAAPNGRST